MYGQILIVSLLRSFAKNILDDTSGIYSLSCQPTEGCMLITTNLKKAFRSQRNWMLCIANFQAMTEQTHWCWVPCRILWPSTPRMICWFRNSVPNTPTFCMMWDASRWQSTWRESSTRWKLRVSKMFVSSTPESHWWNFMIGSPTELSMTLSTGDAS